jgi:hypothetical protein
MTCIQLKARQATALDSIVRKAGVTDSVWIFSYLDYIEVEIETSECETISMHRIDENGEVTEIRKELWAECTMKFEG